MKKNLNLYSRLTKIFFTLKKKLYKNNIYNNKNRIIIITNYNSIIRLFLHFLYQYQKIY